ncbi:MAG TPA: formate dehydrogenase accessory sulfurtransferase FdhD [Gemmatimonadales bacterium]|nr:formate dehydrogenase accessory sulfurtransferase FdhD [Gemmatimonadales bacterium]
MTDRMPPALSPEHPLFGLGYAEPVREREFTRLEGGQQDDRASVAEEVPVAFIYNGRPHVVMMATPADLEDFAAGFSLTEEIVASVSEISRLEVVRHAQGIELQLAIPEAAANRLEARGRQLVGQTGCGLCGVETVAEALRPPRRLPDGRPPVPRHALWRAEAALPELQQWNQETGALHAAAWVSDAGAPEIVREDVGRHNALDKVIGALARTGRSPGDGFLLVTSRASYEMVQKATVAGARLLAAVSRPTGLAVRLAEASGLTLVALLRGRTANVYAHPEGLSGPD